MEIADEQPLAETTVGRGLRARWGKPIAVGLTAVLLLLGTISTAAAWQLVTKGDPGVRAGVDLAIMLELGRRWVETGSMYLPYQLAGPYPIDVTADLGQTPALYPPAAGPVFGALTLLPLPLVVAAWWAIPIGIVVAGIWRWRPAPWTWPLMALCFVHPMSPAQLMVGGTSMWVAALVVLGLTIGWPAALILLKPTMLPFALLGAWDPRWWVVAVALIVVTLLGPWQDYLMVGANGADAAGGVLYSLKTFPLAAVPLFAWLGRTR
jgi:hypothetical protein